MSSRRKCESCPAVRQASGIRLGVCSQLYIYLIVVVESFCTSYFLFHSQMSNLMNQARLKVLKARDDMISVGNTFQGAVGADVG